MNRRDNIKSLLLGGISASLLSNTVLAKNGKQFVLKDQLSKGPELSNWHNMPDMDWAGPKYWANRVQDWPVKNGRLHCVFQGKNRTFHHLTMQLGTSRNSFVSRVNLNFSENIPESKKNQIGFLLGAKTWNREYRAAANNGDGLRVGLNIAGQLFIGKDVNESPSLSKKDLQQEIQLEVSAEPLGQSYLLALSVCDKKGNLLQHMERKDVAPDALEGNIALLSHFEKVEHENEEIQTCSFDKWFLDGKKFVRNENQTFGPLCFTQYTRQHNIVKLTAQLSPVPLPSKAIFEVKKGNAWQQLEEAEVQYPSYTAQFRFENWKFDDTVSFRVRYDLKYKDGSKEPYYWEGEIAKEPVDKEEIKALVCSCNHDMGFPDQDILEYGSMHSPDLVLFLGDQFYEINGGFGFQTEPIEKAYLDYLRKWYMFGWSYRELFQNIPVINLPDDHDVFQGNLFGANGIEFPKASLGKRFRRDYGGYLMPAEWVNLAMTTQTSHMPDPYDPTPIEQGIHVFYSNWDYGGISFGIVEDRKFKSGPAAILPEEAHVLDAFVENKNYPIKEHEYPDTHLLGTRQIEFLKEWVENWNKDIQFKVLVSATPFHALQTLPDENSNGMQRRLDVPREGVYVHGDVPVADMDSGGWPQHERDEALKIIRKAYALHLAGDQHLPSLTQYGVEDYRDAGYSFAVPALANSWPRRWWPPKERTFEGELEYTGNYEDAFGNKMHVSAVANPVQTGLEPSHLYDWSPGYGVVTFNKKTRDIKMECWPRYVNPIKNPEAQFKGWPVTVNQLDNYKPVTPYFLPKLKINGIENPLIKIIDDENEAQLILRNKGEEFQPLLSKAGEYTLQIIGKNGDILKQLEGLEAVSNANDKNLEVSV